MSHNNSYICSCGNLGFLYVYSMTGAQNLLVVVGLQPSNFILILIMKNLMNLMNEVVTFLQDN